MSFADLDLVDGLRQVHRLNQQALLGEAHLGGKMGGGHHDALAPRQRQAANRDAMALKQRCEETRVEASEEQQVAAIAGSVLVVRRLGVELVQHPRRPRRTLGQDEDVGIFLPRKLTDEAAQFAPLQIPEKELRHSRRVAEKKLRVASFELMKRMGKAEHRSPVLLSVLIADGCSLIASCCLPVAIC